MWWSHATKVPFWAIHRRFLLAHGLQWSGSRDGQLVRVQQRPFPGQEEDGLLSDEGYGTGRRSVALFTRGSMVRLCVRARANKV